MKKELSVWSQARLILKGMANGDSQTLHIPADKIDSVRAMSYRIGKFSFSNNGDGVWNITRREPKKISSQRAKVRAVLSENSDKVFFAASTPAQHNNLRNYTTQYDKKNGTIHRFAECDGGVWVSRDRAAEVCSPLMAALNSPDSTVAAIGEALAVVAAFCKAEQDKRNK
jgi:hypothetical protein